MAINSVMILGITDTKRWMCETSYWHISLKIITIYYHVFAMFTMDLIIFCTEYP